MAKLTLTTFVTLCCALSVGLIAGQITGDSTLPYVAGMRVRPFTGLQNSDYFVVDGATVQIEFGYVPGQDMLLLDYEGVFPLTSTFQDGILFISGEAPVSEYSAAISTVTFFTAADDGQNRRLTWTYGKNTFRMTLTGHYYTYTQYTGSWSAAVTSCQTTKYMNMQGYLANIDSADEMDEVGGASQFSVWIGGTDSVQEGAWMWSTGPASGTQFWQGASMYQGGYAVNNSYTKWYRFQPNNGNGDGQNYLSIRPSIVPNSAYWDDNANSDGVAGFVCEYGGMDPDPIASTMNNYAGTVVLAFDCGQYSLDPASCQNHADFGCNYNGITCTQQDCTRHKTEDACGKDWKCAWSYTGYIGQCGNTRCGKYSNAATCAADASCSQVTVGGSSQCLNMKCMYALSASDCAMVDGCSWIAGQCAYDQSANCDQQDVVFMLDGSATMGTEWSRFTTGFQGLTDLFIASQPSLAISASAFGQRIGFLQYGPVTMQTARDQVPPSTTGTGGALTGMMSAAVDDLRYQQARFSPAPGRTITSALSTASSMLYPSGQTSSRKKILVIFAAGAIGDAVGVAQSAALSALKQKGTLILGAAIAPNAQPSNDLTAAVNSLKLLTPYVQAMRIDDVPTQVIYGMCAKNTTFGGAIFGNNALPQQLCNMYQTTMSCASNPVCAWDTASQSCRRSACLLNLQSACGGSCTWDSSNGLCKQLCPTQTSAQCTGQCMWTGTQCIDSPCISNPTEDSCIADPSNCRFSASTTPKCQPRTCEAQTNSGSAACSAVAGCIWVNNKECTKNVCGGYATTGACAADERCGWDNTTNTCTFNVCGTNQNEVDCSSTTRCTWTVAMAPGACIPAPCTKYNIDPSTASIRCAADRKCMWGGDQIRCTVQDCDSLSTAALCSTMPTCVWRNEQCKDTRYVQCPAIDTVFLVEATPAMQLAYGRHPNGFYGLVEQLRSWSVAAPFSQTPNGTGFRMKLFFYGANTAPGYPTTGFFPRYTNGVYDNSQPSWNGAGGQLFTAEGAVGTYAAGTNGNVKIRPALVEAKRLFDSNNVTGRIQLVIIVGHSAITDAGGDLGTAVADLEASGVQIFSNVLRRFSSITPDEQTAANYLSPLASDPMQSHFTFTTLDTLRQEFLDKFCDPSSGTGKVLGISRDRTLPCNWLSGQTECQIQGSCMWNASARVTCPLPNQCANMGCVALPDALAKIYSCENCKYSGGAFQCDAGQAYRAPVGLCMTAPCMMNSQSTCNGPSCTWNADKQRCDRAQCSYTDVTTCNNDLACVWVDTGLTGNSGPVGCRPSVCGLYRSATSCSAQQTDQGSLAAAYSTCTWMKDLTPAICAEARCPNLMQSNCNANPATCAWKVVGGRQCQVLTCLYNNNAQCEADSNCFWNHFDTTGKMCQRRTGECVLSGYSNYSQCSATCGPAVRYKARTIVAFPDPTQATCADVAAQDGASTARCSLIPNCVFGDTKIQESQSCGTSSISCTQECSSHGSDVLGCMNDVSCMWRNHQCVPAPIYGCSTITDAATCNAADSCNWNVQTLFCDDVIKACKNATTQSRCELQSLNCAWLSGDDANNIAQAAGLPSQLINPGQPEIFVFPTLRIVSSDMLWGATVTIESNYSRGKDLLELTYPTNIQARWNAQAGTLYLSGCASVTDYSRAIRYVTFFTTSTNPAPRKITWSFRNNTVYSAETGHWYTAFWQTGVSWDTAKANCANDNFYGLTSYLSTITSDHENTLVTSKLSAEGWISGDDSSRSQWRYSTGASAGTPFWTGPSALLGGYQNPGGFSNWAPGQPNVVSSAGFNHPYLNITGFWSAQPGDFSGTGGYICEYSGLPASSYAVGGATIIGFGGCMPDMCLYHTNQTDCARDSECAWIRGACLPGCSSMSSMTECQRAAHCKWDATTIPAVCDINICVGLGETACSANGFACVWTAGVGCGSRSGCAMYTAESNCSMVATCQWSMSTSSCDTKPCESYSSQIACGQNALCQWNTGLKVCASAICNYGTETQCGADRRCTWSSTNGVAAAFPPGGAAVLPFTSGIPLTYDTNTNVDGMTVAIVEGFQMGQDMLTVLPSDNIAGNYKINYNKMTGVLTLIVVPGVTISRFDAFNFIQTSVRFYSTSNTLVRRRLNYVLGLRMTVSADRTVVFKYIPTTTPLSTFASANSACAAWGMQYGFTGGSVAQIMSQTDNLRLEALTAQGWLAATVRAGTADQWIWTPTAIQSSTRDFWRGIGARGAPFTSGNFTAYAQWAGGEPKKGFPNSYAFFVQTGFWKVVNESTGGVQTGVICQYAVPNNASVFGERNVQPSGCFLTPCLSVPKAQCKDSPQCVWTETESSGQCSQDTWCTRASSPSTCDTYELCYWDYDLGACRTASPNTCSLHNYSSCQQDTKCKWNSLMVPRDPSASGVCTFTGCGVHPKESPCTADPVCRWAPSSDGLGGNCVARLCGYQIEAQCWTDKQCSWNRLVSRCQASSCLPNTQSTCTAAASCSWDPNTEICNYVRCGTGQTGLTGKTICQSDNMCLWNPTSQSCSMPQCNQPTEALCKQNPSCYFTFNPNRCLAAQCTSNTNLQDCEQGITQLSRKPCIWEVATGTCRQLTFAEQNAPVSSPSTCVKEGYGNLWWLWVLAGLCLLLILGIFYRLYLAYSKGLSFFEPAKKTKQFSPHAQFGEELFEEAQQVGQETNINTKYTRPTADEL